MESVENVRKSRVVNQLFPAKHSHLTVRNLADIEYLPSFGGHTRLYNQNDQPEVATDDLSNRTFKNLSIDALPTRTDDPIRFDDTPAKVKRSKLGKLKEATVSLRSAKSAAVPPDMWRRRWLIVCTLGPLNWFITRGPTFEGDVRLMVILVTAWAITDTFALRPLSRVIRPQAMRILGTACLVCLRFCPLLLEIKSVGFGIAVGMLRMGCDPEFSMESGQIAESLPLYTWFSISPIFFATSEFMLGKLGREISWVCMVIAAFTPSSVSEFPHRSGGVAWVAKAFSGPAARRLAPLAALQGGLTVVFFWGFVPGLTTIKEMRCVAAGVYWWVYSRVTRELRLALLVGGRRNDPRDVNDALEKVAAAFPLLVLVSGVSNHLRGTILALLLPLMSAAMAWLVGSTSVLRESIIMRARLHPSLCSVGWLAGAWPCATLSSNDSNDGSLRNMELLHVCETAGFLGTLLLVMLDDPICAFLLSGVAVAWLLFTRVPLWQLFTPELGQPLPHQHHDPRVTTG